MTNKPYTQHKKGKKRIDALVFERGLVASREKARALIMAGVVLVDGVSVQKAGLFVSENAAVEIKKKIFPYVSRGGNKLAHALDEFGWDVSGFSVLDIGASTGGFTHCLLERGAEKVFCVDVGYGQLDFKLRNDPRVINMEKTNFRHLEKEAIPGYMDMAVIDVSFISLRLIIPRLAEFLNKTAEVICLVKPQFELERNQVGRGGIVKDDDMHTLAVEGVRKVVINNGFNVVDVIPSPILGAKGNKEFLMGLEFYNQSKI